MKEMTMAICMTCGSSAKHPRGFLCIDGPPEKRSAPERRRTPIHIKKKNGRDKSAKK